MLPFLKKTDISIWLLWPKSTWLYTAELPSNVWSWRYLHGLIHKSSILFFWNFIFIQTFVREYNTWQIHWESSEILNIVIVWSDNKWNVLWKRKDQIRSFLGIWQHVCENGPDWFKIHKWIIKNNKFCPRLVKFAVNLWYLHEYWSLFINLGIPLHQDKRWRESGKWWPWLIFLCYRGQIVYFPFLVNK